MYVVSLNGIDDSYNVNVEVYLTRPGHVVSNQVLNMSDGLENMGGISWRLALCLLLSWLIVFLVLIKGISSLGKVGNNLRI